MKDLRTAKVCRSGQTSRTWNREITSVKFGSDEDSIYMVFNMRSKGGGVTDVKIEIGADDFWTLAEGMVRVDRGSMLGVMSQMLASELAKQPEHDRAIAREARKSVAKAAEDAFNEAPSGKDHAERLVYDVVGQLVTELNKSESTEANSTSGEPAIAN